MFRVFFEAKDAAHLTYNDGFNGKQEFSIPENSELKLSQEQLEKLNIKKLTALGTFAPTVENQDINRQEFLMNGDEQSVRELHSVLTNSGLIVTYTANQAHQVVKNPDLLVKLIHEEKKRCDEQRAQRMNFASKIISR